MENKIKNPVVNEQERAAQRKRQIRSWLILLGCIGAAALVMSLISFFTTSGSSITATSLPCYAHQDVTAFQDGVLFYDGASIHYVNAGGAIEWSYPVGDGASFHVSETHIIVWAGTQLAIIDANGRSSYNSAMDATIQFARIGRKHAAIVTGTELEATVYVKDMQGAQIDFETAQLDGMVVLDCGFYGDSDQYMWTLSYDFYAPVVTSTLNTFQVGQMNTGTATLTSYLPSKVIYVGDRLHVFTTQPLYTYDYRGVEDTTGKTLVYGWRYMDHDTPKRGTSRILLAPTGQGSSGVMNELRVISSNFDQRYHLPTDCVGAAIQGESLYAFSSQYMYSGKVNSPRFYAHQIPLADDRQVTGFIGLTNNGYAIVVSNSEVFAVSLPR